MIKLTDCGIAKSKRQGQPARNWYTIDPECLQDLILKNQISKNLTTSSEETEPLDVKKLNSINKSNKNKNKKENNIPPTPTKNETFIEPVSVPCQHIADLYNAICLSYPKVTRLSDSRKKAIKARMRSGYTKSDFQSLFEFAESSDFLKGKNNRNWSANFDWLVKDSNMAKVLDGNYNTTTAPNAKKSGIDWSGFDDQ